MLYILEKFCQQYFSNRKALSSFFNKESYKVSSTPLSYRQINSLDFDNLLPDKRVSKKEWRKFTFKDLVYISVVGELKEFGLKHAQLKTLYDAFYRADSVDKEEAEKDNYASKTISEVALGCVFSGVEVRLCVKSDGKIGFYDPIHFILDDNSHSQIVINFYSVVNNLVKQIGNESLPMLWKLDKFFLDSISETTEKEERLLEIIRNQNFSMVRVEKKNGEISTIHPEQKNKDGKWSVEDIVKVINAKEFQKVSVIRKDGKIVNYKVEESIKL